MAAGKTDELVLFAGANMKRYQFLSNTWTNFATKPRKAEGARTGQLLAQGSKQKDAISFVKSQSPESNWYLLDDSSTKEKTYGALIDAGVLYIFGAKPRYPALGVNSKADNILRIQASMEDVQVLHMVLPEPVKCMHVLPYKEHVILAGTNKVFTIKLVDLRMSKTLNRHPNEHEVETGKRKKFKPPVQSSAKVIPSKISTGGLFAPAVIKLCRIGTQLIQLEGKNAQDRKVKYNAFMSADVEDVIHNTEGVHWKNVGWLQEEAEEIFQMGDFVMVPLKFKKREQVNTVTLCLEDIHLCLLLEVLLNVKRLQRLITKFLILLSLIVQI